MLQELGGWKDIKSVQRYAHFNVETLKGYAKGLGIVSGIDVKKDNKKSQTSNTGKWLKNLALECGSGGWI